MNFDLQKSCKESAHFSASLYVNINILHSHSGQNHEINIDTMNVTINAINYY